ncbi:SprT-like domain-containing protein [Ichthyenterobacterium sp. W332]|uniref:SprT-like domain-containing protein n=1 Tax=Microcosmobacter mediterraneus TaxID=3075607 RepID=A0ABU2YJV3_9FLAO|nr:SprT-like domain-containing protein [Ichthyenterobacterium sp. W332]MDT0558438.1 SprT-like domain-containing protein [Ichthyenterobacterium sp. W332]
MLNLINTHLPSHACEYVNELLSVSDLVIKIKNERRTKHGDYRRLHNGKHQITVNANLNSYRFLITLIHEIAHFKAYQVYGQVIKPHGKEWKQTFQHLMLPLLRPEIFPIELLPLLAKHFKNPKASSDTDHTLALALKQFDPPNDKSYIFEIPLGSDFKIYNGRVFKKGSKRRKRFECVELSTGKLYLFNPNAEVELLD